VDALPKAGEFSLECNPGTVDESYLRELRVRGVNRLSIGCQSTHDVLLKEIGRIHSHEEFLACFDAARGAGFENINVDLMFALPGQTMAQWEETLAEIVALRPEHISCYALTPAEGTPLADYEPCEILDRKMYHYARGFLARHGYEHYEISNWARAGYECRHNIDCWEMRSYIGIGPGAASFDGMYRWSNSEDLLDPVPMEKVKADLESERIILGLRMLKGIPAPPVIPSELDGLLEQENGRIRLSERGLDFANTVFTAFL
jgi:oxygen-independent coproporphyrinogen-3 oxidase